MSARRSLIVATMLATGVLVAGCGVDTEDETPPAASPTPAAQAPRTQDPTATTRVRRDSVNDQGGQKVLSGPGSPVVATSATSETTTTTPEAPGVAVGGAAAAGVTADAASVGGSRAIILRPFSASSPWNTLVNGEPVDRRSEQWISEAQVRRGVVEEAGRAPRIEPRRITDGVFINTRRWTVPIVDEEGGVTTRVVCRQLPPYCGDGANVKELTIPPNESPLPEYDGWFTVVNREEGVAYDLWRARRGTTGNVISYQFMRKWDLDGPGFLEPNTVSARGSGLPLFAGLIHPEEIQAGRIEHALAISLPGPAQRNYVQPASSTDGNGRLTSIPEGARIRLKRSVTFEELRRRVDPRCDDPIFGITTRDDGTLDESLRRQSCREYRFPGRTNERAARAIISALQRYGAIVVDRSRVPTLYARLNVDWSAPLRNAEGDLLAPDGDPLTAAQRASDEPISTPLLRGNEVEGLRVSDFEVVQVRGPILKFPSLQSVQAQSLRGRAGAAPQTSTPGIP
jgi:hypothetical protein